MTQELRHVLWPLDHGELNFANHLACGNMGKIGFRDDTKQVS